MRSEGGLSHLLLRGTVFYSTSSCSHISESSSKNNTDSSNSSNNCGNSLFMEHKQKQSPIVMILWVFSTGLGVMT